MSRVEPDTLVVATDHPVTTTVEGEVILLNTETGIYQGLDGVAPHIWNLIQEPATIESVVEALVAEYDVDAQRCERDVIEFIETIAAENLVEIDVDPNQ